MIPHENFFRVRTDQGTVTGKGAWELAARLSYLDLNDQNIRGGTITDLTCGVNWYVNAYGKLMFNYIHSLPDHRTMGRSEMDAFAVRAQVDF